MGYSIHDFQLADHRLDEHIIAAGGKFLVLTAGSPDRATLFDPDDSFAALTQPVDLTRGHARFATLDTVNSVDIALQAPGGQFQFLAGVKPQAFSRLRLDTGQRHQVMKIPFSFEDQLDDNTETPSGFTVPLGALMLPTPALDVKAIDASETIDVGTQGTSNDPNGFLAALSVANLGLVRGTLDDGAATIGVLLSEDESAGDLVPEGDDTAQADEDAISWTLSAGADTAKGYILLPYLLMG